MTRTRKGQIRMDSETENLPATLTAEEEELIKLSQRNTKFARDELVIPRLKMLQQLTPEAQEASNSYVIGAKPGMFYNTSSGKLTPGQEGMICCIIGHNRQVLEWLPNRGGLVKNWGIDDGWKALCSPEQRDAFQPVTVEGHTIDKQRSFLIFDIDVKTGDVDPSFFNMKSTSNKVANQLSSMLTQTRKRLSNGEIITPPYFYYVYKCVLERVQKNEYIWWLPKFSKYTDEKGMHVETQSLPNGKAIFEQAKLFQEQFAQGSIQQDSFDQPQDNDLDGDKITF